MTMFYVNITRLGQHKLETLNKSTNQLFQNPLQDVSADKGFVSLIEMKLKAELEDIAFKKLIEKKDQLTKQISKQSNIFLQNDSKNKQTSIRKINSHNFLERKGLTICKLSNESVRSDKNLSTEAKHALNKFYNKSNWGNVENNNQNKKDENELITSINNNANKLTKENNSFKDSEHYYSKDIINRTKYLLINLESNFQAINEELNNVDTKKENFDFLDLLQDIFERLANLLELAKDSITNENFEYNDEIYRTLNEQVSDLLALIENVKANLGKSFNDFTSLDDVNKVIFTADDKKNVYQKLVLLQNLLHKLATCLDLQAKFYKSLTDVDESSFSDTLITEFDENINGNLENFKAKDVECQREDNIEADEDTYTFNEKVYNVEDSFESNLLGEIYENLEDENSGKCDLEAVKANNSDNVKLERLGNSNSSRESSLSVNSDFNNGEEINIQHSISNNNQKNGLSYNNSFLQKSVEEESNNINKFINSYNNDILRNFGVKKHDYSYTNKELLYNNFSNFTYNFQNELKTVNVSEFRSYLHNLIIEKADLYKFSDGKKTITIQLQPESLGKIQLELVAKDGIIKGRILAENKIVKESLEKLVPAIIESLEKNEIKISNIIVELLDLRFGTESNNNSNRSFEHQTNLKDYKEDLAYKLNGVLKGIRLNRNLYDEECLVQEMDITTKIKELVSGVRLIDLKI